MDNAEKLLQCKIEAYLKFLILHFLNIAKMR